MNVYTDTTKDTCVHQSQQNRHVFLTLFSPSRHTTVTTRTPPVHEHMPIHMYTSTLDVRAQAYTYRSRARKYVCFYMHAGVEKDARCVGENKRARLIFPRDSSREQLLTTYSAKTTYKDKQQMENRPGEGDLQKERVSYKEPAKRGLKETTTTK